MAQVNLGHVVGPGVPTGGTANQVLVKNGATNFDTSWKDASQLPAIGDEAAAREAADAALADGLAIIANGDTHAAVAAGKAVFVRSHSTLASGLYWASSAIGTNAALSTSNLTADASGGLNKLKADIDTLNSKTIKETERILSASNVTSDTYILGLEPGVYKIAGNKSNYLPTRYGILIKFNSGASYGTCVVYSTEGGAMYLRSFYDNSWHTNNWFSLTGTAV